MREDTGAPPVMVSSSMAGWVRPIDEPIQALHELGCELLRPATGDGDVGTIAVQDRSHRQ